MSFTLKWTKKLALLTPALLLIAVFLAGGGMAGMNQL